MDAQYHTRSNRDINLSFRFIPNAGSFGASPVLETGVGVGFGVVLGVVEGGAIEVGFTGTRLRP